MKQNLDLGNFINNEGSGKTIEYDGIINKQSIFVPVTEGTNVIKLGVADTGDSIYDSGLFVLGLSGSSSLVSGTFQQRTVTPNTTFDGGSADFLFEGTLASFSGATFNGFDQKDQIFIQNAALSPSNVFLSFGSITLNVDGDKNGSTDTIFKFSEIPDNTTVNVTSANNGTTVTVTPIATPQSGPVSGTSGNDFLVGSAQSETILGGNGNGTVRGKSPCHLPAT